MNRKYLKKYCTGCGLCGAYADVAYEMDEKGFLTPVLDSKEKIEFCEKVCPAAKESMKLQDDRIWGKYEAVCLGYAKDSKVRFHASSGGVLTALSAFLLKEKMVDGILQVGKTKEKVYGTELYCSKTKEEVFERSGSRYCISSPLKNIKKMLEPGKKYAFIGKPCDVTALKNYMQENKQLREQIIVTLSFFCAGLPSNLANEKLIDALIKKKSNQCKELNYRGNGWPGAASATDMDGNTGQIDYETSWGKILGRDVKYCCRFCTDGIGERADISCGDAWYLQENKTPNFAEREGRNVVFARTNLGEQILHCASKEVVLTDFKNIKELEYMQPYQKRRKATLFWKVMALRLFARKIPPYDRKKLYRWQTYASKNEKLKDFLGTIKRILKRAI